MSRQSPPVAVKLMVYLFWFVTAALGFLVVAVLRRWLDAGYVLFGLDPLGYGAMRNFSIVILAMLWLGGILYIESYYREGAAKGELRYRFMIVTAVLLVPIVVEFVSFVYRRFLV